jgi:hypothetical protein
MFRTPRYIQNSFSIIFPRVRDIRRRINAFEDLLQSEYTQPQVISVPDDFAPEVPRIIFESQHRYSQIVGDFNDRYAFNEQPGYQSTREAAETILKQGLAEVEAMVARVGTEPGAA